MTSDGRPQGSPLHLLLLRRYPSPALQTRLYRDRDHCDVLPIIIGDGLKWVYTDAAAELEPAPY